MNADIEQNKALVRRFFAAIEAGNFQVFDEIDAEDTTITSRISTPGART